MHTIRKEYGCRVLNADGYTRWWNATEFTTAGMYGYDDGNAIPGFLKPTTTLNPYKYFADCLGAEDPVIPNVDMTNRGTFSTDNDPPKLTRNYKIQFPKAGGLEIHLPLCCRRKLGAADRQLTHSKTDRRFPLGC
jgi:hypothetical protein